MSHTVRIAGTALSFACAPDQSILDAALQAGIELPHSCRKGVCGNCEGGLSSGEVAQAPGAGEGLHAGRMPQRVLYCRSYARSALEISPDSWREARPEARQAHTVRVLRHTRPAPDVSVLLLRLPAGRRARFRAGQYLQVRLPDGSRRSYSMASPPHQSDALQLHVRHVAGGAFTQRLHTLQPGDTLEVELPYGAFTLREGSHAPLLCVAGGTGFAPLKSMLDDLARRGSTRAVTLVWGARDRAGLYALEAVLPWQAALRGFSFVPAVEDAADAEALAGFHGRVDEAVRASFGPLAGFEVYACGSPAMIAALRQVCVQERGLGAQDFFSDVFVPGPAG